ncbi:MAG TPA: TraR/DksA C4-type zinc finger protein [Longimicrobiales bacterium]|nr:TraR/DksA C4-type zinc finger protein [Longimicrobiales bacterium]
MKGHLSAEQLAELRSELERQLRKLQRSMRTTSRVMKPVQLDQSSVGRLSRIDNLQTQGLTAGLQAREQAKLGQINEALKRIDDGTYGQCVVCGSPIAYERLLVFPEAPNCVACTGR